jgi:Cu-Zn family superoxide dismutase
MDKYQAIALSALAAAGLAFTSPAPAPQYSTGTARAAFVDAEGRTIGSATLQQSADGVHVTVRAGGLPPGPHGLHLHAVGACDGPAFASAGGHFNPHGRQHGLRNPEGAHAGDLPALTVAPEGMTTYAEMTTGVTLAAGPVSLFDADGTALVIHAADDDQVTDPTGNSGGRIACGVLHRGPDGLPDTGGPMVPAAPAAAVAGAGLLALGAFGWFRRRR